MLLIKFDEGLEMWPRKVGKNGIQGKVLALWIVKYAHIIFLLLCILLIKTMQCCKNYFKAWVILKVPINARKIKTTEWGVGSEFLPLFGL